MTARIEQWKTELALWKETSLGADFPEKESEVRQPAAATADR
jgi:hypothetical protein